jgi:hypothetical protein
MENPYESDPDHALYEIFYNWSKESLIIELIDKMTEDEKIEIVED